ncbi:MAG: amino acid ABC transporter substrate-binding protein, partial [Desulfobacteraceae bacterium]|nr:amino acid ABC transporter substrate-binding protein [Desulfobacteraceae bacterium]
KASFYQFISRTITKEKTIMRGKLATILLIVFFASPLSAQELTGTLQQIKKTGQIRIGYRTSEPPMSFLDKDGKPNGYSIDLCKCIVTEVKKRIGAKIKVEYVPVTAEGRFKALADKKIDILCGTTTKTLSRSELVDFTQLTFVTGASLMTLRNNKARDSSGFDGKKIGVVKGTTTAIFLKNLIRETSTNAKIALFNSAKEGVDALRKKKIDAYAADQIVLIGIASKAHDRMNFVIDPNVFSFEPFAFAVRRNDADFRLVADRAISDLYRSKKIFEIYDKWIGEFTGQRLPIFEVMVQLNATPE